MRKVSRETWEEGFRLGLHSWPWRGMPRMLYWHRDKIDGFVAGRTSAILGHGFIFLLIVLAVVETPW